MTTAHDAHASCVASMCGDVHFLNRKGVDKNHLLRTGRQNTFLRSTKYFLADKVPI